MAIPTQYTEATLKAYLHSVLGAVATALGWSVDGGSYNEVVNEAVAACGVSDIAQIAGLADVRKLRALARRELWRAAAAQTTAHYDIDLDGAGHSRSQFNAQAQANLRQAEIDCLPYDPEYSMSVTSVA